MNTHVVIAFVVCGATIFGVLALMVWATFGKCAGGKDMTYFPRPPERSRKQSRK